MYSKAKKIKADVYHVCDMDCILVGYLLKKIAKKRVIYDIGDDYPSYNNYPHFVQSIIRELEGRLSKSYDTMIVLSDTLKKDRVKYTQNIHVMYYAPDPSFNPKNTMDAPKDVEYVLVFEGQISIKKGLGEVLEALPLILKELSSVKLLIIGEFRTEEDRIKILSLIDRHNLKEHVHFIGWMEHTEVPKYINQGDLGMIIFKPWTYSYLTGVPNKLIDYMACGKPVVASKNFPEIEKIVKGADCGILAEHNDPKKIADAVLYLLRNDEIRIKMGENGRRYVEKSHDWESYKKRLLKIYEDLTR
jgi:glycosyltransferase involved in cell wall biosynthesis